MDGVIPIVVLSLYALFGLALLAMVFLGYKVLFSANVKPGHFWTCFVFALLALIAALIAWSAKQTIVGDAWIYFVAMFCLWSFLTIRGLKKAFAWT